MSVAEKSKIISANNVTIAENEQKVYKAGQLNVLASAESLNGKLQGATVKANDVANIEHNVPCKLASKNLYDGSELDTSDKVGADGIYNNDFVLDKESKWYGYIDIDTLPDVFTISTYIYCSDYGTDTKLRIDFFNANKKIISYNMGTKASGDNPRSIVTYNKAQNPEGTKYIVIRIRIASVGHTENTQIELSDIPTPYEPYTTDFSGIEVKRYGKNLFDTNWQLALVSSGGSILEVLDNGVIAQGVAKEDAPQSWGNGWIYLYTKDSRRHLPLKAGYVVTVSCDYTILELAEGRTDTDSIGIYIYGTNNSQTIVTNVIPKLNQTIRAYTTYTINADDEYSVEITTNSNKVRIENLQIEISNTVTPYEPYTEPQYAFAEQDGTVNGITSIAPNMTLLTNAEGVIINADYYKDPDIVISNLAQSVALSGGEG